MCKHVKENMEKTKDYWNEVANEKIFSHPLRINEIEDYVNINSKILDVGCGYGRTLDAFYKLNYHDLTGIDYSQKMIDRGKLQYPYINFQIMENNEIPYHDNTFDCVILFAVLTCIIGNREQEKIISEIHRVLKSKGIIYISDYLLNTDQRNIDRYEKYKDKYENYGTFEIEGTGIVRHLNNTWIKQLITSFKKINYVEVIHTTMNGNKANGFYFIGQKQ
jgi:SAM-dependent methyltransferase